MVAFKSVPTFLALPLLRSDLALQRSVSVMRLLFLVPTGWSTLGKLDDRSLRVPRELLSAYGVLQPPVPRLPDGLGFLTLV